MRFGRGPQERAAQERLDDAHRDGRLRTQRQAETLSDAVWKARERDREGRSR